MKQIINYPGSKWAMADWIISYFPQHHSYLEPFFGSGAVLFNKRRSNIETVNDLDGNITNLFWWIRHDPERLAHEIYYTPYARQVYDDAVHNPEGNDFEKAVKFYIRMNMGHGFRTNGNASGWKNDVQGRERAYAARNWCSIPDRVFQAAERLRGVQIESRPALKVIKRFRHENVLIYADPPYLPETRNGGQYQCEMDDTDHEELLDVLEDHPGPVLISGYDSKLYRSKLRNWYREERISYAQNAQKRTEILWMNFEPIRQIRIREWIKENENHIRTDQKESRKDVSG